MGDEDERYTQEDLALPPQNGNLDAPVSNTVATPPRPPSPLPLSSDISTATPDQKSNTPTRQPAPSAESSKSTSTPLPQASHKLPIPPRMTHALPPKPVTTNIPYVPPSDPSIVEATAMASRPKKGDNTGQNLKNGSRYDHIGPLPAPWEIRIPRSGEGHYYHNNQSGLTQWNRPVSLFHLDFSVHHAIRVGSKHPPLAYPPSISDVFSSAVNPHSHRSTTSFS